MGIFNTLFGKKNGAAQPQNDIPAMRDWGVYSGYVHETFSSISLDLSLKKVAPVKNQPNVVWVSVTLNIARPNGMPSREESVTLESIEKNLSNTLAKKQSITFIGKVSAEGVQSFYFYSADTVAAEKTIAEVMRAFPEYKYSSSAKVDPGWSEYFALYPSSEQQQSLKNLKVVYQLQKNGDVLTKERSVDHWIYFKLTGDREAFSQKVEQDGFVVLKKDTDLSNPRSRMALLPKEYPYVLHIARSDKVDYPSVEKYTLKLWKLAKEHNGEYDGWGTEVVK